MKKRSVIAAFLFLLAGWQLLSWVVASGILPLRAQTNILPGPLEVLPVFFEQITGELGIHFLVSLWRVIGSMLLAVALAVPVGLAMGQSNRIDRLFSPVLYLTHPIPKVVFVPVVVLFFGIGDLAKIVVISLILFFQILVLVRDAAKNLRRELLESVRSLGAGRRGLFLYVYLPASLPGVLTALRISVGTAVAVLYVAELYATRMGLGYYIFIQGSTFFNYPAMYAGIFAMAIMGLGLYFAIDWLEHRLCPWEFVN